MNTFKKTMLAVLFSGVLITQTSCLGSFALTVKVYEINNELTDNKFINNLVFWLVGGPVYGFTTTVDVVVLNLIEFWTGNNLLANAPTEPTDDRWAFEGKEFKTIRTHDRIDHQAGQGRTSSRQAFFVVRAGVLLRRPPEASPARSGPTPRSHRCRVCARR